MQFRAMDPSFPIQRQLGVEADPVVLINLFTLNKRDEAAMLEAWTDDAQFMQRRPGFISTQLHRAVGESCAYLNYAIWESSKAFQDAFTNPEFQSKLSHYPSSVIASPHLFQKVAVPGICVA